MNARNLSSRVEFVGLCGSGKSTFYGLLQTRVSSADLPIGEERPATVSSLHAMIGGVSFAAAMALRGAGSIRFLSHSESWWLPFKLGYRDAQMRQGAHKPDEWRIHVDSGLLQPIVSFAAEHNDRLDPVPLAAILPTLALPRILIYLHAPAALALERYLNREHHRLDASASLLLQRQFAQAYYVCETLVAACREAGTKVIIVDANQSRSETEADRVAATLRSCVRTVR